MPVVALLTALLWWPWPVRVHLQGGWGDGGGPGVCLGLAVWGRRIWAAAIPAGTGAPRPRRRLPAAIRRFLTSPGPGAAGTRERSRRLLGALVAGLRYLARHTQVVRLAWRTRVGVPDAHLCALVVTALQVGQTAVGLAASRARPHFPLDIRVEPDYRGLGIYTSLDCALTVPPVRVLVAGWRMLVTWRRQAGRGGRPPRSAPVSHRGSASRPCYERRAG